MGRQEEPVGSVDPVVARFALGLRQLREQAGSPGYRTMASSAHYSRTALSEAARGRELPTLAVALAYVRACGGDQEEWYRRWQEARAERAVVPPYVPVLGISPAGARQPVADGSDPDRAGCHEDAVTVHSRRMALDEHRIIGLVELRYSPRTHAAWARFVNVPALDHIAARHQVDVLVEVFRDADGTRASFRHEYCFDVHWSDLLVTSAGAVGARAAVYIDGQASATAETECLVLP